MPRVTKGLALRGAMPRQPPGNQLCPTRRRAAALVARRSPESARPPNPLAPARGQKIVLVQVVHNQDNGTRPCVVQPAVEGVVVPLVGGLPLGLRQGLLGFQRIVDNDDVRTGRSALRRPRWRVGSPAPWSRTRTPLGVVPRGELQSSPARHQLLMRRCRQSRDNLSARSCA